MLKNYWDISESFLMVMWLIPTVYLSQNRVYHSFWGESLNISLPLPPTEKQHTHTHTHTYICMYACMCACYSHQYQHLSFLSTQYIQYACHEFYGLSLLSYSWWQLLAHSPTSVQCSSKRKDGGRGKRRSDCLVFFLSF